MATPTGPTRPCTTRYFAFNARQPDRWRRCASPTAPWATFGTSVFFANTSNFGGAVFSNFNDSSPPKLANCIVLGQRGAAASSRRPRRSRSSIRASRAATTGVGNIDADPHLRRSGIAGDFTLQPGSPCIDAGINSKVPEPLLTEDLYGGDRAWSTTPNTEDTGIGPGPIVDMGIAEIQAGCYADFNGDGSLDVLDFVAFQIAWVDQDAAADCDANDQFNILDFVCFQLAFETGCP